MRFPSQAWFLRPTSWVGVALLLAAVLLSANVRAGESPPAGQLSPALRAPVLHSSVLLADDSSWSWSKVSKPLGFVKGSRRSVIQMATLAMCVALYIIWWRKFVK